LGVVGMLALSFMICGGVTLAAETVADPSYSFERIFAAAGLSKQGLDWGESFGVTKEEDVGQNLYAIIYKKTVIQPRRDAINATAKAYGVQPERMALMLNGNIVPVIEEKPGLTQEQAQVIVAEMQENFQARLDTTSLAADVRAQVEPNEMFANGDVSDSGFDLIHDLNLIDKILFEKIQLIDVGGAYVANSPSQSGAGVDKGQNAGSGEGVGGNTGSGNAGEPIGDSQNPKNGTTNEPESGNAVSGTGNSIVPGSSVNPQFCATPNGLASAIQGFQKENGNLPSSDAKVDNNGTGDDLSNLDVGTSKNTSSGTFGSGATGDKSNVPSIDNPVFPPIPQLTPAKADNWKKDPLCNDLLCLSVDFVKKPVQATYTETDNCIACHVEYINRQLQKTVAYSLIPNKATGNFGELAKCKNAVAAAIGIIGLNISVSTFPVVTPAKDDLVNVANIADQWDAFSQVNSFWNYSEDQRKILAAKKSNTPKEVSPSLLIQDKEALSAINNAPDEVVQGSITERIDSAVTKQKVAEVKAQTVGRLSQESYGKVAAGEVLRQEMLQMNTFFENYRLILRSLNVQVPGITGSQACQQLADKKACT